jgi:hypothetical protein
MGDKKDNVYKLRDFFPELITSLLYASAVSSIFSLVLTITSNNGLITLINTIIIILLIFIDWNNRILIPTQFTGKDKEKKGKASWKYLKLTFEISSIIFLITFFRFFVAHENGCKDNLINIYSIFALYLFSCGFWNLVLIKIMTGINSRPLMKHIINGNVFDLPGLETYTGEYVEIIKKEKKVCEDKLKTDLHIPTNNSIKIVKVFQQDIKKPILKMNQLRIATQFIGNHILWVNFYIAILFIFKSLDINLFNNDLSNKYILIVLCFFILMIAIGILIYVKFDLENRRIQKIFGLHFLMILIVLYSSININYLIYLIILQQIITGVLIERLTHKKTE